MQSCQSSIQLATIRWKVNSPKRFLVYLASVSRSRKLNLGAGMLATLQSPQAPSIEAMIATLLNEIVSGSVLNSPKEAHVPA